MIQIVHANTPELHDQCLAIRTQVFVDEQGFNRDDESDAYESLSQHFLIEVQGEYVATARIRASGEFLKVERVATLKAHRGNGYAAYLLKHLIQIAQSEYSHLTPMMHAQMNALGFYQKLGWVCEGDVFMEEDVEHIKMTHPAIEGVSSL